MKTTILIASVGIGCTFGGLVLMQRLKEKEAPSPTASRTSQLKQVPTDNIAPLTAPLEDIAPAATETTPPPEPSVAAVTVPPAQPEQNVSKASAQAAQRGKATKDPLRDPLAREALALVGIDPTAETYWEAAINDPDLSGHERSDLIEDLNEDGLSDPKHPAPEDLPVILNRIRLIETVGPYAMDQVNADAFQEAYKDLINLADLALGGGEPVR